LLEACGVPQINSRAHQRHQAVAAVELLGLQIPTVGDRLAPPVVILALTVVILVILLAAGPHHSMIG
jgi:hypothetical protein